MIMVAPSHAEEAVVAEVKKGARITGADRDKLAVQITKKYEGGASIRELAESTGRSYGFVHRVLSESGATMRGRGGATRGGKAVKGVASKVGPSRSTKKAAATASTRGSAKLHSVK